MEKSDFDRLLERYLKGEVTEDERIKLEAWLDTVKTNVPGGLDLDRETEDKLFQKITSGLDNTDEIIALVPTRKLGVGQWILRIAATVLVIALATYSILQLREADGDVAQVVAANKVEKRILSDGSLVWVRGDSKLVFYEKPTEGIRYSELDGQALFEVAKDPTRPFIVQCGDARLKVLGTSFSVKARAGELELKVLTGKVNLSSQRENLTIDVEPNEQVIYRNGTIEKSTLSSEAIDALVAQTEYNMEFSNVPMSQVFRKIEDKFDVRIRLDNASIGRCRINADLTDHSLESTLQMITEVLAVTYSRHGNTITVRGKGCE